jgi:hypothetical protein
MWFILCLKPLDDEKKVTTIILDALRETGQRGIISRGWGDLGSCKCLLINLKIWGQPVFILCIPYSDIFCSMRVVRTRPYGRSSIALMFLTFRRDFRR